MATNIAKGFTLSSLVLGCQDPKSIELLKGAVTKLCSSSPKTEAVKESKDSQATETRIENHGSMLFKLHDFVPESLYQFAVSPGETNFQGQSNTLRKSCEVLSTTPFSQGYVNSNTEIYIILTTESSIPNDGKLPYKPNSIGSPVVEFAKHTSALNPVDDPEEANAIVQLLNVDEEEFEDVAGIMHPVSDQDVYINLELASKLNVMNEVPVTIKRVGDTKTEKRRMTVIVTNSIHRIRMTRVAWLNLGGWQSDIFGERAINIATIAPEAKTHAGIPSSASSSRVTDSMEKAARITVGRVSITDLVAFNLLASKAIEEYMKTERYLRVGDVFVLKIRPYSTNVFKSVLMKVIKINGSDETKHCHIVDSTTKIYEESAVKSFIPSGITNNRVKVGTALESTRKVLLDWLKSFIKVNWRPNPLPFIILSAPEGSGKTVLATQIANIFQCNFIEVNCLNLVADGVNTTETNIRGMLTRAKEAAPVVLLLKNIDMLTRDDVVKDHNHRLSQYVAVEMEEAVKSSKWPIIVLGTCSKLNSVCEDVREIALREIVMQAPDVRERLNILEDLTDGLDTHPDLDLDFVAEHTAGLLYGDLKALVTHAERSAMIRAHAISEKQLGKVDQKAIDEAKILIDSEDFEKGLDTLQGVQSLDLGTPKIPNVKWSDIGGLEKVKGDILDTIQLPLKHPELFISTMRRSGVLLYGPPGTGKTLLAKAVATECALNFFSVKGPELINMYVGQSEENVRQVFQKARSASPCVIFFDELDSLAPNRGKSGDSGGVMDRVVSQLLAELDGLVKSCDVFVIGATNRPDLLDSALLRPGRFDKLVYVGISSTPFEQLMILTAITRKFKLESESILETVSQTLPRNLTGADLYSICSEAMTNAIKRRIDQLEAGEAVEEGPVTVNLADFKKAAEQTTPSLSADEIEKYELVRLRFSMNSKGDKDDKTENDEGIIADTTEVEDSQAKGCAEESMEVDEVKPKGEERNDMENIIESKEDECTKNNT